MIHRIHKLQTKAAVGTGLFRCGGTIVVWVCLILATLSSLETESLGQASFDVGAVPGYPGTTVSLPITLTKATNAVAAQFDIGYSNGKITAGPATVGPALQNHLVKSRQVAPGLRRYVIYSMAKGGIPQTNRTILAKIPFTVSPQERVGSGPISTANVLLAKHDATAISSVSSSAGAIFMTKAHRDDLGTVEFFLPSEADEKYLIQATTNFVNWVNISTNVASGSFMDLIDNDATTFPHRFYRSALYDVIASGRVGSLTKNTGSGIEFQISGLDGRSYVIQASSNLVDWMDLSTNTISGGIFNFSSPINSDFPQRFYRLKSE